MSKKNKKRVKRASAMVSAAVATGTRLPACTRAGRWMVKEHNVEASLRARRKHAILPGCYYLKDLTMPDLIELEVPACEIAKIPYYLQIEGMNPMVITPAAAARFIDQQLPNRTVAVARVKMHAGNTSGGAHKAELAKIVLVEEDRMFTGQHLMSGLMSSDVSLAFNVMRNVREAEVALHEGNVRAQKPHDLYNRAAGCAFRSDTGTRPIVRAFIVKTAGWALCPARNVNPDGRTVESRMVALCNLQYQAAAIRPWFTVRPKGKHLRACTYAAFLVAYTAFRNAGMLDELRKAAIAFARRAHAGRSVDGFRKIGNYYERHGNDHDILNQTVHMELLELLWELLQTGKCRTYTPTSVFVPANASAARGRFGWTKAYVESLYGIGAPPLPA